MRWAVRADGSRGRGDRRVAVSSIYMYDEVQQADDQRAVPRTLQSLLVLRISLCVAVAVLAVVKICLSPPSSAFLIDLLTNSPGDNERLSTWVNSANLIVTGLLSTGLALIIATFLIHARVLGFVAREPADGRRPQ